MIIETILTSSGEYVEFEYPLLRGISLINSCDYYLDNPDGANIFIYFKFSKDGGISWSEYEELDNNLDSVIFTEFDDLIFKFKFQAFGVFSEVNLHAFTLDVEFSLALLDRVDLSSTVFKKISITDEYFNSLYLNFLRKFWDEKYIPKYVVRGKEYDVEEEGNDFVLYLRNNAFFYALLGALSDKEINHFFDDIDNLKDFLKDRTFLSTNVSNANLKNLKEVFLQNVSVRGTRGVFAEDDTHLSPNLDPFHGEFLRLIDFVQLIDEYLFSVSETGWFVNQSSPIFGGSANLNLNKLYKILDFDLFDSYNDVSIIEEDNKNIIQLEIFEARFATKFIKVDSGLTYDISFFISSEVNFGVFLDAFNSLFQSVEVTDLDNNNTNVFIVDEFFGDDDYRFVRLIIYPFDSNSNNYLTNINVGQNLRFKEDVKNVQITFTHRDNINPGAIKIKDFTMKPLLLPSVNYINSPNLITIWAVNNNKSITPIENLMSHIIRYLIPYNNNLQVVWLQNTLLSEYEPTVWLTPDGSPFIANEDGDLLLLPS